MHAFQGETCPFNHQTSHVIRHRGVSGILAFLQATAGLVWLRRLFAARPSAEDVVASEYEGRGWCDETERALINDVATWAHRR
jgi:hypothetical protein